MPQVPSALPTEDDGTYEASLSDNYALGPPLDYFNFDNPNQLFNHRPIAFPPDPTSLPAHAVQLSDYIALYNGQPSMDLNLLSSENYPELPYENSDAMNPEANNPILYGGLIPAMAQSGDKSTLICPTRATRPTRSRNSSKKEDAQSTSPDESNAARQRGRPRLDTRDQTAAERRRTQVRLAQRAYRQRKETTISGLNKRVSELERTIENMNKSFLDFNDKALASGIHKWKPGLAQDLKATMGHFLESARQITEEVDEDGKEQVPALSARVYGSEEPPPGKRSRTMRTPGQPPLFKESSSRGEKARPAPWGYDTVDQGQTELVGTRRSCRGLQQHREGSPLNKVEWDTTTSTQQYRVELPETTLTKQWTGSSLEKSLPLPSSYSVQETSFARRLLRQSLESAFRLMTNPNSSRRDILRLCKFTFYFSNSEGIIKHLQALIRRTAREDLEHWEAPQLHLGGAGLHYPRVGLDGIDSSPPAWWAAEAPVGPLRPVEPETPAAKELNMTQIIELAGFDGEWFDSNDVEQYLRSKGLYLDAQSSWVEIEVPELIPSESQFPTAGSPTESSLYSSKDQQSPRVTDSFFPNSSIMEEQDSFWNADTMKVLEFSDMDMDYPSNETNPFDVKAANSGDSFDPQLYLDPILPDVLPTFNTTTKKFIDVEKFLSSLINTSVCLGRTPGFRRSAIDSALAEATHNGW